MSMCARCGTPLREERFKECTDDSHDSESAAYANEACLERQLSNLRALLRAQTLKLEEVAEEVRDGSSRDRLARLIGEVLEALS
jgi:hypothetical protein